MKKTVDKIPFYRLGWNKLIYFHLIFFCQARQLTTSKTNLFWGLHVVDQTRVHFNERYTGVATEMRQM
jgi:hypothetical protein